MEFEPTPPGAAYAVMQLATLLKIVRSRCDARRTAALRFDKPSGSIALPRILPEWNICAQSGRR